MRDPDVQRKVLESVIEAARAWDGVTVGVVDSGLPGPKGNREFFVHLEHRPGEPNPDDIDRWIADAVGLRRVTRAAVVTHGTPGQIGSGLARLQAVAPEHGVELLFPAEEAEKHGVEREPTTASARTSRSSSAATARCCAR